MSDRGPSDDRSAAVGGAPGAKIPNDEFYRAFQPPTPRAYSFEPTSEAFHEAPAKPGHIAPEAFFRREARPETKPTWLRRPLVLGGAFTGIGAAGVLLGSVSIVHDIVLVAPIFEELFKFGLALLLVAALRAEHPMLRLLIALLPGVSFGVMEHYVTYGGEPLATYAFRVLFHSGSTALSMTVYSILEPLADARARLFSTVPSTVLHWLNNASALVTGIFSIFGVRLGTFPFVFGLLIGLGAHALAWGLLLLQRNVRLFAARQVTRLDPWVAPQPPAPPPATSPLFVVGDAEAAPSLGAPQAPPVAPRPAPAAGERRAAPSAPAASAAVVRRVARAATPSPPAIVPEGAKAAAKTRAKAPARRASAPKPEPPAKRRTRRSGAAEER